MLTISILPFFLNVFERLFNPFPNDKFETTKLKEFADDKFKLNENGEKLSERVENTVGKGKNC